MSWNLLPDDTVCRIIDCAHLESLRTLLLLQTRIALFGVAQTRLRCARLLLLRPFCLSVPEIMSRMHFMELNLSFRKIGDECIKAFSTAISSGALPSLTRLDLRFNQIGNEGMIAFADAIKPTDEIPMGSLASLTFLGLDENQIGDTGMIAFADAIKPTGENPMGSLANLTWLVLQSNQIGDEGMKAFSSALSSGALPALKIVYLSYNPGDDTSVRKALADRYKCQMRL